MSGLSHRIFKDVIRPAVSGLDYRVPDKADSMKSTWTLKERILGGSKVDISIQRTDRYSIEMAPDDYYEAMRVSAYRGLLRMRKQQRSALECNSSDVVPTAWALVACYYATFFASIEALRSCGKWFMFFTGNQIQLISSMAVNPAGDKISSGFYLGQAEYDKTKGVVRIVFGRKSGGAHKYVWSQADSSLLEGYGPSTGDEYNELLQLKKFLGCKSQSWVSPSDTRNTWNYQVASYYDGPGERAGVVFKKLLANPSAAIRWAENRSVGRSCETEAAVLPYLMVIFTGLFECTKDILFDAETLNKLKVG